jgi:hypothetical protein
MKEHDMAQPAPEYREADWRSTQARHEAAAAPNSGRPVVENAIEARQGVTGHGVRYVLMISLAAVVLAFALIYAVFWA